MDKAAKLIYLMMSGSMLWIVFTTSLPMHQMLDTQNLMFNATDSFISQAYADESENESDNESTESSSNYDFSSATLVCINRSIVLSALGLSSEGDDGASGGDNSSTVTQSYITSLPGCTVFSSSTVAGIWIPFTAITTTNSDDNEISLNSAMILDYFTQLSANTAGLTGTPPNSTMVSYREMLGE